MLGQTQEGIPWGISGRRGCHQQIGQTCQISREIELIQDFLRVNIKQNCQLSKEKEFKTRSGQKYQYFLQVYIILAYLSKLRTTNRELSILQFKNDSSIFLTKHSKLLSVLDKEVSLNVVWQAIQNQVREAVLHEIECFMEMQSGLFCKPVHMIQGEGEGIIQQHTVPMTEHDYMI